MFKLLTLALSFAGVVFLSPVAEANAPYCREFTKDVLIGGQMQKSYGTACLQPDGSWQVVNSDGSVGPETVIIRETQVIAPPPVIVHQPPVLMRQHSGTSIYLGLGNRQPYYYYPSHRHHFHHHHRGPGAHQHWKHHRNVLSPPQKRGHHHGHHHHRGNRR